MIVVEPGGVLTVAGGKLTTYRRMAEEVVDKAVELLEGKGVVIGHLTDSETALNSLVGAVGWPEQGGQEEVARAIHDRAEGLLTEETALLLAGSLGMRGIDVAERVVAEPKLAEPLIQGRHEIMAQVDWAVEREFAVTVTDVMMRRTQLYYRDSDQGLTATNAVAERMAEQLGWSEEERLRQIEDYRKEVERSRRWRSE